MFITDLQSRSQPHTHDSEFDDRYDTLTRYGLIVINSIYNEMTNVTTNERNSMVPAHDTHTTSSGSVDNRRGPPSSFDDAGEQPEDEEDSGDLSLCQ